MSWAFFKEDKMDQRRFFSKLYFGLLAFLLILPCSMDVHGADWIRYVKGDSGKEFFYDVQNINYLPNNSVQVSVKMIPGDEESRL